MAEQITGSIFPGERVMASELDGQPVAIVFDLPDTVRLPRELGGNVVRVTGAVKGSCPCSYAEHVVTIMDTDAEHDGKALKIAECAHAGFLWHTVRAPASE